MQLDSARGLKQQLLTAVIDPFSARASQLRSQGADAITSAAAAGGIEPPLIVFGVGARPFETLPRLQRSVALGVARHQREYKLAVRVQRPSLVQSPLMNHITHQAKGEVDVRIVGRIDKRVKAFRAARSSKPRAAAAAIPWYRRNTRPLLIGASVGHVDVTAGTLGAFVVRANATFLLSNNHVLANEDLARTGDRILQRAAYDGGKPRSEGVARLRFRVRLKPTTTNQVDAALAEIDDAISIDASRLVGLLNGRDRALAGVGPAFVDEGETVFKIGRTTGPTEGRVTAFDLDNVVVNYDKGNLRFDNQLEIEGVGNAPFSDGGDSGSLIVNTGMKAIALLFAGGDAGGSNGLGLTYANPIHPVLKDLNARLLS